MAKEQWQCSGWEGNRRSYLIPVMHHRLWYINHAGSVD